MENDSQTPLEEALLLQQRFSDHLLYLSKSWTYICPFQLMENLAWSNRRACPTRYVRMVLFSIKTEIALPYGGYNYCRCSWYRLNS
jgi:hypothetical protein